MNLELEYAPIKASHGNTNTTNTLIRGGQARYSSPLNRGLRITETMPETCHFSTVIRPLNRPAGKPWEHAFQRPRPSRWNPEEVPNCVPT